MADAEKIRTSVFPMTNGDVTIQAPTEMTAEDLSALQDYFDVWMRIRERSIVHDERESD